MHIFMPFHEFGHQLVISYFSHDHWWLHLVVHIAVFVAPLALLTLLLWWVCYRIWKNFRNRREATSYSKAVKKQPLFLPSGLVPGVFHYILTNTRSSQIILIAVALVSMPILYVTLELPKLIINNAIESGHFPVQYFGFTLDQIPFLLLLSSLYLLAVLLNSSLKYYMNVYKGRVGERLLRRLRLTVYRLWRRSRNDQNSSQLIPVLVQEIEPVGSFSSDAFVLPIFQGGTFLTILIFILVQDPFLGAAAVTLLPVQLAVIPRLQRRINLLARQRVKEVRNLGSLVGNQQPDKTTPESQYFAPLARSIKTIQRIRFDMYRRKYFLKSLNNIITHLTPFFFYSIGGYLVIEEKLTLGALIAVLAAYKDFTPPLRELFKYYQRKEDVRVRYEGVREFLGDLQTNEARSQVVVLDTPASGRART